MKRNINRQAIAELNLDEEFQSKNNSDETIISDTDTKSRKSKSSKKATDQHVYLPVIGLDTDEDDYSDVFTQQLLKVLRRTRFETGVTTTIEAYVKNNDPNGTPWLLLSWYKNRQDHIVLDEHYVRANDALYNAVYVILKPIIANLHKNLNELGTVNSQQLLEMIKGRLPVCYLKSRAFHVEYNGSQYVVPSEFKDTFVYYAIHLLRDLKSPVKDILYITNDESKKDIARYFYSLKPSKNHFTQAPVLEDYSKAWSNFLKNRFNNPRMDLFRVAHHIYGLISAECHSRQALALFDTGDSGKTVFKTALAEILPGVIQIGITLKDLCGEFMPPQINGCRGLIIDEGEALQKFFNGDFFKEVTGASDDNAMRITNRKCKDHAPMRVGSMRFMFLSNSRLCIHDKAGLTRISPMFFRQNYGRKRLAAALVNELKAEGNAFIQFCVDSETYYRNITSKYNHWYCPLIEDNGNINVLTDEQFDDWYNERSDELYFSEDDQHNFKMRNRLMDINIDNCIKATTNPDTGEVMVYGSLSNDIVSNVTQELLTTLFIEEPKANVSLCDLACFIYKQIKDPKSRYGDKLKEIGFKYTTDTTASSITKTRAWNTFKNNILKYFSNATTKRIGRDKLCVLTGIQLSALSLNKSNITNNSENSNITEFDE